MFEWIKDTITFRSEPYSQLSEGIRRTLLVLSVLLPTYMWLSEDTYFEPDFDEFHIFLLWFFGIHIAARLVIWILKGFQSK